MLQKTVEERLEGYEEVHHEYREYREEEKVIRKVFEEVEETIGESQCFGVDLDAMDAAFGHVNVSKGK